MSMSTHIIAFRDMDGEFKRMLEAKQFCDERNLSYPKEVQVFFHNEARESIEYLTKEYLKIDISPLLTEWADESQEGYELEVARLPKDVKTLRFYNSW